MIKSLWTTVKSEINGEETNLEGGQKDQLEDPNGATKFMELLRELLKF